MARKLASFIDGFLKYTEGKGSPYLYRLWTAISIVTSACERKVWIENSKGKLYPNQYVLLVGPPGIGKSLSTNAARDLLSDLTSPETPFFLAPTSVTKASLIDALAHAERRIIRPMESPPVQSFNSLTIVPNEFGVFLPAWDAEFMSVLTDLWDCGIYAETRRTKAINISLPRTQLSLLSATTPSHLTSMLPEGAWETGFMSRVVCIYSGEIIYTNLWAEFAFDASIRDSLVADLRSIYKLWGKIEVGLDVQEAATEWVLAGAQPVPDHPKLMHYNMRRVAHLLKLCIAACVATSDDMVVTLDHYVEALSWLVQAEASMPDIFKSMKSGGDARTIDECWHHAYQIFMKEKQPIAEHRLFHFLQERTPVHNVERLLDVMQKAGMLKKLFTASGGQGYEPAARRVA